MNLIKLDQIIETSNNRSELEKKNCKDCIRNNRHPNAIGCLECKVFKRS